VQALLAQAGVMSLDNIHQLFDVGQLLAHQPLPAGPRLAVVGNSSALGALAAGAAAEAGLLVVGAPVDLGAAATAADFAAALDAVLGDDGVDCVAVLYVPPLVAPDADVAAVLAERAGRGAKTVVSTFRGLRGVPDALRAPEGPAAVPSYATPEDAVRALATVARYAAWRAADPGRPVQPDVDVAGARAAVAAALEAQAGRDDEGLDQQRLSALLRCYGIDVWPVGPAPDVETAVRAAARIGYPVALKTLAPHLRHRSDLGGVRLDVHDEADLRGAYAAMSRRLGPGATEHFVVQAMAPAGVACVLGSVEDPLIGPVVSFGLAGVATELLGDLAYRIPPLTDVDVAALVRSVRAAPLLFGHRGTEPVDVAALEDLLARVSRLADDLPEVAELELNPVVVSTTGLAVLSARARLTAAAARTDRGPRALPG
jgi:acyl-CoA synthetase (NDP forming)